MGVEINPKFVEAADTLIKACQDLKEAEATDNEEEIAKAEEKRHEAETIYCQLQGMIDGTKSEEEVQRLIDAKMSEVSIFYD